MTRVYIREAGGVYSLTAKGHANTAEACAAISSLTSALADWSRRAKGVEVQQTRLEAGDAQIVVRGSQARAVFEFLAVAFAQLRAADPAGVSLDF